MVTKINEAKAMVKHISCDYKCKLDSTTLTSNQKWNNKTSLCDHRTRKKYYSWNPSICISENGEYLKSVADDSVIVCDVIIVADSVSTNVTNTVSANVTSTLPIHSDDKKVRYKIDYYILHTFLLVTTLLFV